MSLVDYAQSGSKDCLFWWIEYGTKPLANISGGSAFNFGIYHRKGNQPKTSTAGKIYAGDYAWLEKYGATAEQAFATVKASIIDVVEAVLAKDLARIDQIPFSPTIKWKLAFLYQDPRDPLIVPIFSKEWLDFLTANPTLSYSAAYQALLARRGQQDFFSYADELVLQYEQAHPKPDRFSVQEAMEFLEHQYGSSYSVTQKLAAFKNGVGRELVLDRTLTSKVKLWISKAPNPACSFISSYEAYAPSRSRNSNLKSLTASLGEGQPAYYIQVESLSALEQLCHWYEHEAMSLAEQVTAFIQKWSDSAIGAMTLSDYHQAADADSFARALMRFDVSGQELFPNYYGLWEKTGSTPGNMPEKYTYAQPYSWETCYGHSADQALSAIKQQILQIISAARQGQLDAIEQCSLTPAVKWIIAFVYQGFEAPCILPIFKRADITRAGYAHLGKLPFAQVHAEILKDQQDLPYFEFVEKLWNTIRRNQAILPEPVSEQPLAMSSAPFNQILYGPAGTGKTYHTVNQALQIIGTSLDLSDHSPENRRQLKAEFDQYVAQQRIRFVTFHQSFSYEDFVEGIRIDTQNGQPVYQVQNGVFKQLCEDAMAAPITETSSGALLLTQPEAEPRKPYVLIIDEINRGNISRIFGELITLIEDSKRQGAAEALATTLPYSKQSFCVPDNVYLIGTMNSSDRSLTGIDIALRRRFTFIEMQPQPQLLSALLIDGIGIESLLQRLNQRIAALLDADHCIGHALFMPLFDMPSLQQLHGLFEYKIIPLLQEYFYDDWQRINWVLNNNGFIIKDPVDFMQLFSNVGEDRPEHNTQWVLNSQFFRQPFRQLDISQLTKCYQLIAA